MRTTILLTMLLSATLGYFIGINSPQRTNIPLKPVIAPDAYAIDYFTIKRSSEDGQDNRYSVITPDSMAYDFLNLTELDSVLSGYKLYDEKHNK